MAKAQEIDLATSAESEPGNQIVRLYPVCENNRWGFIDATGKVVIPLNFDCAYRFSDGLARVEVKNEPGDETEGFIDSTGRFVIGPGPPPNYKIREGYENIWGYSDFHEGYAGFWAGDASGRGGYIDKTGRAVIPVEFQSIRDFSEGLACVSLPRKDGSPFGPKETGFIDKTGKFVIGPGRSFVSSGFVNGLCYVFVSESRGAKYGYIDREGKTLIPLIYDYAANFAEGLACVRIDKRGEGKYGFIDSRGAEIIPIEYDDVSFHFVNGVACAVKGDTATVIDRSGRVLVKLDFKPHYVGDFVEGLAYVALRDSNHNRHGFINVKGEVVIPCEYDQVAPFRDGLALVHKGSVSGYINHSGEYVWTTTGWKSEEEATSATPSIDSAASAALKDQAMPISPKERPALDFMAPYNVTSSEFKGPVGPIWAETATLPKLTAEEFGAVRNAIVRAISKHSTVYGEVEGDSEFCIYDDKYFDRTQKVEITSSEKLSATLPAVVAEVQRALKFHPLWRVMFVGEGYDSQASESFFVVYPDVVRIKQLTKGKTVAEAVKQNAFLRNGIVQERKLHQRQRNRELQEAIVRAIRRLESTRDEVFLVAWYDTLCAPGWDWGLEGKPGTSIWLLLRSPLGIARNWTVDGDEPLKSDVDHNTYWTSLDGRVARDEPATGKSYQLLEFVDTGSVLAKLNVDIKGQHYSFTKSKK